MVSPGSFSGYWQDEAASADDVLDVAEVRGHEAHGLAVGAGGLSRLGAGDPSDVGLDPVGRGDQGAAHVILSPPAASVMTNAIAEKPTPNQKPEETPATTTIRIYNGAEARLKQTIAYLKATFGVTPTPVTDPAIRVDVIVVTAPDTPTLAPPNAP